MGRVWRRPKTNVGKELRKRRRELKWSQLEAAQRCGYSQQHYSRLESGNRLLHPDSVCSMADAMGIEEDLLMKKALDDRNPAGWEVVQV